LLIIIPNLEVILNAVLQSNNSNNMQTDPKSV